MFCFGLCSDFRQCYVFDLLWSPKKKQNNKTDQKQLFKAKRDIVWSSSERDDR